MKTANELRRDNLARLIAAAGGSKEFSTAIEKDPSQVSQWANASPDSKTGKPRQISHISARNIERCLNLPSGWMDQDHATELRHSPAERIPAPPQPIATGPTGAPAEPTLQTLLDALAARLAQADPSIRQEIAQLVMRYMENPQAGARIAAAVELLLEKHAPDDSAL